MHHILSKALKTKPRNALWYIFQRLAALYVLTTVSVYDHSIWCFVFSEIYCTVPRQARLLRVTNPGTTVLHGTEVNVQCVAGYHINGQSQSTTRKRITCGNGGQWTPSVPSCLRKCCLWTHQYDAYPLNLNGFFLMISAAQLGLEPVPPMFFEMKCFCTLMCELQSVWLAL